MSLPLPPADSATAGGSAPPWRRAGSAPPDQPPPRDQFLAPPVLQHEQEDLRFQQEISSMMRTRTFRDFRFRMNNYFEYHRRGLVQEYQHRGQAPWDEALVDPTKALVPYDRRALPEDWNSIYRAPLGRNDADVRAQQAANMAIFRPRPVGFIRPQHAQGDPFVIDLRDWLRDQGLDVRSLRHLGAGGTGLATLFKIRSSTSRVRKKFVVKSSRRVDDPLLQYEKSIQMNLRRSPHIIRPILWADDLLTGPISDATRAFCQQMDDLRDMLFLEFMTGGNLSHLIGKAIVTHATFPNGVLWNIFFCLVRACINMEYPARLQVLDNGDWYWDSETGEDGAERVPDQGHQTQGYGLVHFDLDPLNVMIGDRDARHLAVPVFKAGDFSHSSVPRNPTFDTRNHFWGLRKAGKRTHLLPEQFHKEWEYVRNFPHDEFPTPKVAGNYGPKSNIWAIGMIMHDIITRNKPPEPPAAFGPMNGPDASLMPDSIPVFRDIDGNRVDPFYTHGYWLRNVDNIDNNLKELLIRCLADQPAHRPSLQELNTFMDRAEMIVGWNDNPDDREWFDQLVNEAPGAADMVDPVLDLTDDHDHNPPVANRLSFVGSVFRTLTSPFRAGTSPATQPPAAPQAPQSPQLQQNFAQNTMTMVSSLIGAVGAGLHLPGLSGVSPNISPNVSPNAQAPQPDRDHEDLSDDSAWIFNANMNQLASGLLALENSMSEVSANPLPAAVERAADRLRRLSTPVRQLATPPLSNAVSSRKRRASGTPMDSSPSNANFSRTRGRTRSSSVSSLDDDTVMTPQDPAAVDGNGAPYDSGVAMAPEDSGVALSPDDNVVENDPDGDASPEPDLPPQAGRGPRPSRVKAVRIPQYGLFEKPPPRPHGYHYGRRLYLSPAEVRALAGRGIRAPHGRRLIRLVHVPEPMGDSYERPTIFYQIEPPARAPRPPSDKDPEANILYCTLPVL